MFSQDAPRVSAESLRGLFPGLAGGVARFDGPGVSQVPAVVIEAVERYLHGSNARPSGGFPQSKVTEAVVEEARQALAAFLGASPDEVGFGLNATAINGHLAATAARTLQPGDEIVITELDHQANIVPWQQAAADHNLVIRTAPAATNTRLDIDALAALIGERTRIVAFPWANNALGTMTDVPAVARLAHAVGAVAWCDATHYLPHGPVSAREAGADVLIGSAYKFFGPHLGVFYLQQDLARRWRSRPAQNTGGDPDAALFEQGTLPFEGLAGLTAALRYLGEVGWDFIQAAERRLGQRFLAGLPQRWQLHGISGTDGRTATFALTLDGHDPRQLARELAQRQIAVSAGNLDCPAIMRALGLDQGVLRAGFLHYNTEAEVDRLLAALTGLSQLPDGAAARSAATPDA